MPFTEGKTERVWGVIREKPWHLAGTYKQFQEARAKAKELGPDYRIKLGDHSVGSDDFIWTDPDAHRT